jgi:hypothetical protein
VTEGNLHRLARQFAASAEQILNTTICTGVTVTSRALDTTGHRAS